MALMTRYCVKNTEVEASDCSYYIITVIKLLSVTVTVIFIFQLLY